MYKIYINGTMFCSSDMPDLAVISPIVTAEINKAGAFEMTIPPTHPYHGNTIERSGQVEVYMDSDIIFDGFISEIHEDFYLQKTIVCEGSLSYLNDTIIRPYRYTSMNVSDIIGALVLAHNTQTDAARQFGIGTITSSHTSHNLSFSANMDTTLDLLMDNVVGKCGGCFYITKSNGTRYLNYTDQRTTASQTIRTERNLLDFMRNTDGTQVATVCVPLGAKLETQEIVGVEQRLTVASVNEGKDYIENASAIALYGKVTKTIIYDSVTDPSSLLSLGTAWLAEQLENITIEATAFDLSLAEDGFTRFRINDNVLVYSSPHAINEWYPITKLEWHLNTPDSDRILLGTESIKKITDRTTAVETYVTNIPTDIDVQREAARIAAQVLHSATGGTVYMHYNANGIADELYILDGADIAHSQKWWRWNINGWGYTANAGQTYTVAATMDGTINASIVKTGILQSTGANPNFYLDLDNGTLNANFTSLKISGANAATQSYADTKKAEAISTAASDATSKANTAQANAISAAATDATTKANNAQSAAISTASADATTKANAAQANAISTAAADATTKASNAQANAIAYTDTATSRANVISTLNAQGDNTIAIDSSGNLTVTATGIKADVILGNHITAQNLDVTGGSFNVTTSQLSQSKIALTYGDEDETRIYSGRIDIKNSAEESPYPTGKDQEYTAYYEANGVTVFGTYQADGYRMRLTQNGLSFMDGTTLQETAYYPASATDNCVILAQHDYGNDATISTSYLYEEIADYSLYRGFYLIVGRHNAQKAMGSTFIPNSMAWSEFATIQPPAVFDNNAIYAEYPSNQQYSVMACFWRMTTTNTRYVQYRMHPNATVTDIVVTVVGVR